MAVFGNWFVICFGVCLVFFYRSLIYVSTHMHVKLTLKYSYSFECLIFLSFCITLQERFGTTDTI